MILYLVFTALFFIVIFVLLPLGAVVSWSYGSTIAYAINSYHQKCCEFESRSGEVYSIQYFVIKFVNDLWQVDVFSGYSGFLHQ
jgi:hypothetical protein